jgi:hypothetical protein
LNGSLTFAKNINVIRAVPPNNQAESGVSEAFDFVVMAIAY